MSKKLQEKQQRRLAEERRRQEQQRAARRRNLITIGIALLVLGLVVGSIFLQRQAEEEQREGPVGVAADQAGCDDIDRPEDQGREHIEVGAPHEAYSSSPPTSGPHYETPSQTGFFRDALPPEQLVHNLEHGQIVIWFRPDAPEETIDNIEAVVDQERGATVAAEYEDIDEPYTFVLAGWGALQRCTQVSQDIVDDFRREFQGQGPEALTPPFEG